MGFGEKKQQPEPIIINQVPTDTYTVRCNGMMAYSGYDEERALSIYWSGVRILTTR